MSQELEGTLTNEINLVGTFGTTGGGTTNYNDLINKPSINNVTLQGNKTGSQLGLVSSTDIATVATTGSYNDLTNKPTIPAAQVNADWNSTSGVSEILNKPTLATVATSGSYDDLTNKPTIPAAQVNADWNSTSGVSEILNKPTLATVATSGSYNDLSNTPTIPVNSDFALSGLSDTSITTPSANQVLAYDSNGKVVNTDIIDEFSTITENQTGVTLANSTFVTIASKSLTKGYYVIAGTVQFSSDENGMRILILDNSETDTNTEINSIVVKGRGTLQKVRCMKVLSNTTIYLRGYQSSGSSMSGVRGYLEIMKVG